PESHRPRGSDAHRRRQRPLDGRNRGGHVMPHISKRRKAFVSKVDRNKTYAAAEALKLVKETATAKFDEAIDVAVNLGIDAKKGDQTVRGSVVLPAGTGKKVRVAVFAPGDKGQAAKAAGADIVGMEDIAEQIKAGKLDLDVVIAAQQAMRMLGALDAALEHSDQNA